MIPAGSCHRRECDERNRDRKDPAGAASAANLGHVRYFLFIGGSSTKLMQNPLGFTCAAFLMTMIFILLS
jgi:hypothetical protein